MPQRANSTPPPTPNVVKTGRKRIGVLLAVLISLGAIAGVTATYVILPHFQGSNNNGGSCTANCRGTPCGAGCLQGNITGNNNPSSPYVQLVNLNATSSTDLKMTLQAVGASQLVFNSVTIRDTSTGDFFFESCQQCKFFSNYTSVFWAPTSGSLFFKTGDSYTVQLSDSGNSSTYYFHF